MQRKIKRAANALQNKLDKERKAKETAIKKAKAAAKKEAKLQAAAAKKAQKEQQKSIVAKAKKAIKAMPKPTKALPKVKALVKVFAQRSIIVPNPTVVVVVLEARKSATRTITRPQRYM